jgi:hypothetical protein
MSSPAASPIGRVISFAGIDQPVRATAANVTSGEVRAHHVGLSEAMVTTVPVRVAPILVLRLAADLGGQTGRHLVRPRHPRAPRSRSGRAGQPVGRSPR